MAWWKAFSAQPFPVVHWVGHPGKMQELSAVSLLYAAHVSDEVTCLVKEGDNDQQSEATNFEHLCPHLVNAFLPPWCFPCLCKVYWQVNVAEIQVIAKLLPIPRQESEMLTQSPWSLLCKFICYSPSVTYHSGRNCGLRPLLGQTGTTRVHPNPDAGKPWDFSVQSAFTLPSLKKNLNY